MKFEDVLYSRRTTRQYLPKQIKEEDLQKLLDAAQTSPIGGGNYKKAHLTVVQDADLLNRIRQAVGTPSKETGEKRDPLYGAPTLIFFSATDLSSSHVDYANAGCLIENILLQATALNLGSTYIWGCLKSLREHPELIKELNLPQGYEILSAVAVGYPAAPLERRDKIERISVNRV
ncbi:MAG: nitroreductase family protein [Tissierellia bacterium]|nr:nitroreductase family protein [Tissierellia bacterium]